jgi:hypothetical protein
LARELKRTRAELMHGMSAREFTWWQELYALEAYERQRANDAHARSQRRRG